MNNASRTTSTRATSRVTQRLLPALALCTSICVASSGIAQAANVVPGADESSLVVVTDSQLLSVTVNAADAAATEITGAVTNNSPHAFTCAGPKAEDATAGDVTTAAVVARSENYYRINVYRAAPKVPVKTPSIPIVGPINLGEFDLGTISPLLQGFGSVLGQGNGERKDIADEYSKARVAGHAGLIPTFVIKPGDTVEYSAPLGPPSSGARTDFNAATFLMCTRDDTKQPHVFTGYEEGTVKPQLGVFGSLGSPSLPSPGGAAPAPADSSAPASPSEPANASEPASTTAPANALAPAAER